MLEIELLKSAVVATVLSLLLPLAAQAIKPIACSELFTSQKLSAEEQEIIQDFYNLSTTRHTLLHTWENQPPRRLVSDRLIDNAGSYHILQLREAGQSHVTLFGQLSKDRWVTEMGVGIVEARLFKKNDQQNNLRFEALNTLATYLRDLEADLRPNDKIPSAISQVFGRLESVEFDIWVGEHIAGVPLRVLKKLNNLPEADPRKVSNTELEAASTSYYHYRNALHELMLHAPKVRLYLYQLGRTVETIPASAFLYINGRWHLNLLAL